MLTSSYPDFHFDEDLFLISLWVSGLDTSVVAKGCRKSTGTIHTETSMASADIFILQFVLICMQYEEHLFLINLC